MYVLDNSEVLNRYLISGTHYAYPNRIILWFGLGEQLLVNKFEVQIDESSLVLWVRVGLSLDHHLTIDISHICTVLIDVTGVQKKIFNI